MPKRPEKENQLKAIRQGSLTIGDIELPAAVLENRDRVVSVRSLALGLGVKGGGAYWKMKKDKPTQSMLPEFVSAQYLAPYIGDSVKELLANTVPYIALNGQESVGIKAELLPKICDIWVQALNDGALNDSQKKVAQKAYILLSAFAEIGIIALVDEATGFQKDKDEYQKLVERYIAQELQPWLKVFGDDYYKEIYRLKGWDWSRYTMDKKNHPWAVANITNRIVYEKLPVGVIDKLKELNPMDSKGNRPHRHHQHLSPNEGQVHLLKHLGAVVNILEQYDDGDWDNALHAIDTRFPSQRIGAQIRLDLETGDRRQFNRAIEKAAPAVVED